MLSIIKYNTRHKRNRNDKRRQNEQHPPVSLGRFRNSVVAAPSPCNASPDRATSAAGAIGRDADRYSPLKLQRLFAASRAIARRHSGAARALPPFKPPLRANSVAGFPGGGLASVVSSTDRSTISLPSGEGSRGRWGRRRAIVAVCR